MSDLVEALDRFERRCGELEISITTRSSQLTCEETMRMLHEALSIDRCDLGELYSRWNGFHLRRSGSMILIEGYNYFDDLSKALYLARFYMNLSNHDSTWRDPLFPVFVAEGAMYAYGVRAFQHDDPVIYQDDQSGCPYPLPAFPSLARAFDFFGEALSLDVAAGEDGPAIDETEALGQRMFPDMPAWFGPPYPPVSSFLKR